MVYTLMTFSYVVIEGFRTMGYDMTDRQRQGYIHCWNVVGYLMGIREELLPATFDGRGGAVRGDSAASARRVRRPARS